MKKLRILILLLPLMSACGKKKNKSTEYFSFYANGVHYDYPQYQTEGGLLGGPSNTLGAGSQSGNLGYQIYAFSLIKKSAPGVVTFNFSRSNSIPTNDTIILGTNGNWVTVNKFLDQDVFYKMRSPLAGRIVFTERTAQRLTGTFEFEVETYHTSNTGGIEWTGNILSVTNGKFSIILTN